MKKRIVGLLLALVSALTLCACGQKKLALSWQEQYDLGVRYLSEGNYEEVVKLEKSHMSEMMLEK